MAVRALLPDSGGCLNEVHSIVIVLFHTCCDSKNVQVKDDVLWQEFELLSEYLVSTLRDSNLFIGIGSLTLLIEGHHNHCSTILLDYFGLFDEILLSFFEGDRVDNAFALGVLEASLDDLEFRGVYHHGYVSDLWV